MYDYDDYSPCEECERGLPEVEETKNDNGEITFVVKTEGIKEAIVSETLSNLHKNVMDEVKSVVRKQAEEELKTIIKEEVLTLVQTTIKEMLDTETVSIGGGWDKPSETLTYGEFIKREIKDKVKNGKVSGDRYNSKTFQEYFTENCIDASVKMEIDKQVDSIKKLINIQLKEIFDQSTKNLISEQVTSVLMATDTYKKVSSSIKTLAGE